MTDPRHLSQEPYVYMNHQLD